MLRKDRFNASPAWQHLERARAQVNASAMPDGSAEMDSLGD